MINTKKLIKIIIWVAVIVIALMVLWVLISGLVSHLTAPDIKNQAVKEKIISGLLETERIFKSHDPELIRARMEKMQPGQPLSGFSDKEIIKFAEEHLGNWCFDCGGSYRGPIYVTEMDLRSGEARWVTKGWLNESGYPIASFYLGDFYRGAKKVRGEWY